MIAFCVTLVSGPHLAVFTGVRFSPGAPFHLAGFLLVFFRSLLYANLDMARRVLSPSLPIRPAVVEVETALQSVLGRLLLTNAITLTPGTLSVDVDGKVTFIRLVRTEGHINILGQRFKVGKRLKFLYVIATIHTQRKILKVYHKGRLVKEFAYKVAAK